MTPEDFEYIRASSVDQVLDLLAEHGDEAKVLAGGHSLLPLMKLRLAAPALIIDVGRLTGLSYIRHEDGVVRIGALTRHCDVAASPVLRRQCGVLAQVAAGIGDPQVRHRGTIGGSLAHGDPASDLPAAVLALDGAMLLRGRGGERLVNAADFFQGFLETAVQPDELLVEVQVRAVPQAGYSFQKFVKRAQDWAIVGAVAVRERETRVALVNMGSTPLRAMACESVLASGGTPAVAAQRADDGCEPPADVNATADYRRHLARVLVRRALHEAGV